MVAVSPTKHPPNITAQNGTFAAVVDPQATFAEQKATLLRCSTNYLPYAIGGLGGTFLLSWCLSVRTTPPSAQVPRWHPASRAATDGLCRTAVHNLDCDREQPPPAKRPEPSAGDPAQAI